MTRYGSGGKEQASYSIEETQPYRLVDGESLSVAQGLASHLKEIVDDKSGIFPFGNFVIPDKSPREFVSPEGKFPISITAEDIEKLTQELSAENRAASATSYPAMFTTYEWEESSLTPRTNKAECTRFTSERPNNAWGNIVVEVFSVSDSPTAKPRYYTQVRDDETTLRLGWPGASSITSGDHAAYTMMLMGRNTAVIGIR